MIKQAIWVLALIGRNVCEAVLEAYEHRPGMDDPLPDEAVDEADDGAEYDCGLMWTEKISDDQRVYADS